MEAIGLGISAYSAFSQKGAADDAAASADAQAQLSYKLGQENLQFQKDQYADWKAIYGSVQDNLGAYYKKLTPERITTLGLQNQQKEYQKAVTDIRKIVGQRGLKGSGLETATLAQARLGNAEARASIRTEAIDKVNQQKLNFLSIGMGTGQALQSNIAQIGTANANAATQRANSYLDSYTKQSMQAYDTMSSMGGTIAGWGAAG